MLSSAQNIAPKAALPPAAQTQPGTPANTAGGPSFAQFLTEQASPPTPPAQNDTPPNEQDAASDAAPAQAATATPPRRAAPPTAKPAGQGRASDGAAKVDAKAAAKADTTAAADGKTEAARSQDEDAATETPELKEFTQLIGLTAPAPAAAQLEAATAAVPAGHRTAQAKGDADDSASARNASRAGPLDASARGGDTADAPQAKAADRLAGQADKRAASSELQQAASASTQTTQDAQPAAAPTTPAAPSFAAALAQALPTPPTVADTPAATYAGLQAPLHSAAFAPELGARVSLLAVDGVQHAELQLNPADMGPVSVQIVVDGSQAQVSFHAAQAETRQALEQSLPDLAAALQGQGLTLSGGGVFQQAARDTDHGDDRRDGPGGERGSRSGAARGAGPAGPVAAPVRRSVGLLDTFA